MEGGDVGGEGGVGGEGDGAVDVHFLERCGVREEDEIACVGPAFTNLQLLLTRLGDGRIANVLAREEHGARHVSRRGGGGPDLDKRHGDTREDHVLGEFRGEA